MSVTSQQNINYVQSLSGGLDAGSLFRLANDGDFQAIQKVAGGEGGPDFVCTAKVSAADTVNFDILFDSMLKLYATRIASVSALVVRAKVSVLHDTAAFVAANNAYYEVIALFGDNAGTPTIVGSQVQYVVIEGTGAGQDATLSISGQNVRLAVQTLGATAKSIVAQVSVQHIQ